ncbi:MAG: hypothetical protein GWP17_06285 [Aquificales bacterium]|nr:hypothetical protein [Aquificales bacterium]
MAQISIDQPQDVVKRNLQLVRELMQYLYQNPHLLQSLPDDFELVVLPEDDPEIRLFNLELLDAQKETGKPIVFARIQTALKRTTSRRWQPELYVPIVA